MHPGRKWAPNDKVVNPYNVESLTQKVADHFAAHPPVSDPSVILHNLLESVGTMG